MIRELLPAASALAFRAMREPRPEPADEAAFVRRVDEIQRPEGYRLKAGFAIGAHHLARLISSP